MKTKSFQQKLSSILVLFTILSISSLSYTQQRDDLEEIKKLKEQIGKLELKVNEQAEAITKLQKEISALKSRSPLLAIPKSGDKSTLPKGSREFYFNGQTYYIVPLDKNQD